MEVKSLLIDVTFYFKYVQKPVLHALINNNNKKEYYRDRRLKG